MCIQQKTVTDSWLKPRVAPFAHLRYPSNQVHYFKAPPAPRAHQQSHTKGLQINSSTQAQVRCLVRSCCCLIQQQDG